MMMKRILALVALGACACEREPQEPSAVAAPAPDLALPAESKVSKMPALVPRPTDQAQLDRMILAGYTPHGDHLHAPGVNECPMSKGSEMVM